MRVLTTSPAHPQEPPTTRPACPRGKKPSQQHNLSPLNQGGGKASTQALAFSLQDSLSKAVSTPSPSSNGGPLTSEARASPPPRPPLKQGGERLWCGAWLFPAEGALAKSVSTLWGRAFKVASSRAHPRAAR